MSRGKDLFLGFHWTEKAHYATGLRDVDKKGIIFGEYSLTGGCTGEMAMEWLALGNGLVPKLQCYSDALFLIPRFDKIFEQLSEINDFTKEQFVEVLLQNGFRDLTRYKEELPVEGF
jgi:hypothetical protein